MPRIGPTGDLDPQRSDSMRSSFFVSAPASFCMNTQQDSEELLQCLKKAAVEYLWWAAIGLMGEAAQ